MMTALIVCAAVIAAVFLLSLLVFIVTYYNKNDRDVTGSIITGPDYEPYKKQMTELIESAVKIDFREVYITSYDGLRLFGRVYFQNPGAPFHIQFNGYRGNGLRDFAGGLKLALSSGQNVLLVDQRAHGKSQGHTITFGIKERRDVLSWIKYIIKEYGEKTAVYLEGVSMGAATVLMAADLDLPRYVCGIIADCPYSSPFAIIAEVSRNVTGIKYLTRPFIWLAALVFGHFNIFAASAEKAVKNTKTPILLIHGTGDHFVPYEMSRRIHAANPQMITFVSVEGAPHGISYICDYEKYKAAFYDFLAKTGNTADIK